jgi:hypothetical protein
MRPNLRILITGACGVTSRAVIRSLKQSINFSEATYIGTDICENIYGLYEGLFNKIYKVPHSNHADYKNIMNSIISKEQIDVAIIIPELEVIEWATNIYPVKYLVPHKDFCMNVINKGLLYETLKNTGLVPKFEILKKDDILNNHLGNFSAYPLWVRDFSSGSTSGKGALKVDSIEELQAWIIINRNIDKFMIAKFLSGGNYACHLLYHNNEIVKIASYERLVYFMAKVVPSGISGNIAQGRLINNREIVEVSKKAIEFICKKNNCIMNGIVAVDLKADKNNQPYVTEINIRHVAATSAFAAAGVNLAEYQLLLALDKKDLIEKDIEKQFPQTNRILRDIDGLPIWVANYKELYVGDSI